MKKIYLMLIITGLALSNSFAQYTTMSFDYEKNRFGENQPLPAEKPLIITGLTPPNIDIVEIKIFTAKGKAGREALGTATWKRPFNKSSDDFSLPVNYELKASKKYDLMISFYEQITPGQRQEIYAQLTTTLDAYLLQSFNYKKEGIKLVRNTKEMMADMNEIVTAGLSMYRSRTLQNFNGFSDIVRQKLEQLEKTNFSKAKHIYTTGQQSEQKNAYRDQLISELKKLIHAEVRFVLNHELAILVDSRYIDDYPTEDRSSYFALNIGYGGVYLNDKIDDFNSFGDSPYIGVGLPFSTSTIAPRFFQNASLTLGVFTRNFENDQGEKITGPIFDRPIYAGLDYKLFQFVRINLGAALLEKISNNGAESSSNLLIRPFIGVSGKINISVDLDK